VDGARGRPGAQRRGGVHHPDPYDALLRLEKPGQVWPPRHFGFPGGGPTMVAMNFYMYGDQAAGTAPVWHRCGKRGSRSASDSDGEQERMRKLKIIEHISLDGVISPGAPGEYATTTRMADGRTVSKSGWAAAVVEAQGTASTCCLAAAPTISGPTSGQG